ncbi:hypothetical protein [Pseudoclavibacter helvolus]|uniref:hypothetical protein n=1 Tax=Pseudoclavibacter helvolus TaxID=255205 RepID=UPI00083805C9|nr:hypothetical protein [Pseudoclavibacter helvolus]
MTDHSSALLLRITLGYPGGDELQLRFSGAHRAEILALLDEEGLQHNTGAEFAFGPAEWIENVDVGVLTASGGAALTSLAVVVHRFLRRHDGKHVELDVDGNLVKATGFSAKEVAQLMEDLPRRKTERDREIRKRSGFEAGEQTSGRTDPEA